MVPPTHQRFELWFPFTPSVIAVAEDEIAAVHNRPFAARPHFL
jgi:hypothetical protein